MRYLLLLLVIGLTSCTGLGGLESFVSNVGINNEPGSGVTEAGCFEAEYTGTWTKSRVIYRKMVIPDGWPEGVEIPGC